MSAITTERVKELLALWEDRFLYTKSKINPGFYQKKPILSSNLGDK